MEKLIARINELAQKGRTEGLTAEEKHEQDCLRQAYLAKFREHFRSVMDNTVIIEPNGTKTKVKRVEKSRH